MGNVLYVTSGFEFFSPPEEDLFT